MKIFFSHGRTFGPKDPKIIKLAEVSKNLQMDYEIVDASHLVDAEMRVTQLLEIIHKEASNDILLVGSSMGGYVSVIASQETEVMGMFLVAPSLYLPNYKHHQTYHSKSRITEIIHGQFDQAVPVENAKQYAKKHNAQLHILDTNHTFDDAINQLGEKFEKFLQQFIEPSKL